MIWIIAYLLFLFFAYCLARAAGRECPKPLERKR